MTQYAARLAEGLASKSHKVSVLCSQHDKKLKQNEVLNGVVVTRLSYWFKFFRSVITPLYPIELVRLVRKNEAVVAYLPLQEVLLVSIVSKIFSKKLFLVHNGDLVLPDNSGLFARLVEKFYYFLTFLSMKLSDGIFIQSQDYANHSKLLKKFRNKWKVVMPLFDLPEISRGDVEKFIGKHRLKNKIRIGFSGRFVEEKGVEYLLMAIPLVMKKLPKAHFIFVGENKVVYERYWEKIEHLVKKYERNISLLGLINDKKEMAVFYKSLDVLVQPSKSDCFPSSQIEALLSGIPTVCTNIPGARWAVRTSGMGVIVRPKSPEAIAEGIVKVIENRQLYIENFPKIKKIFNYSKTISNYEKVFNGN